VGAQTDCGPLMQSLVQQAEATNEYGSWDACCARTGTDCYLTRQSVPAGYEPCDAAHSARAGCNRVSQGTVCMIGGDGLINASPCGTSLVRTCASTIVLNGNTISFGTALAGAATSILANGVLGSTLCCSTSSCSFTSSCVQPYSMACVSDGVNIICIPFDQINGNMYAVAIVQDGHGCLPPPSTSTTSLSSTVSSPPMPSSPTSAPISNSNTSNLNTLTQCCGSSTCTFTNTNSLSDVVYGIIVGTPVTNCQAGANSDITDTIGGSITIGETWSVDPSIGFDLGPLKITIKGGWSHTKSISYDQRIGITVHPGYQGALVANVRYNRTGGNMQVNQGQGFPVVSNQPMEIASYGANIVACPSQFNGTFLNQVNCTYSAGTWWKGDAPSPMSLAPMIAFVLLSIFVVV